MRNNQVQTQHCQNNTRGGQVCAFEDGHIGCSLEHHERKELRQLNLTPIFCHQQEYKFQIYMGWWYMPKSSFCSQLSSLRSATWGNPHRTTSHGRLMCVEQERWTVQRPDCNLLIFSFPHLPVYCMNDIIFVLLFSSFNLLILGCNYCYYVSVYFFFLFYLKRTYYQKDLGKCIFFIPFSSNLAFCLLLLVFILYFKHLTIFSSIFIL